MLRKSRSLGGWFFAAAILVLVSIVLPATAYADSGVRIHIMPYNNMDAILVECDGHFGMVDSGEDSSYPDGTGAYPLRPGVTKGSGIEGQLLAYMRSVGVTRDNFEFYIGTHPHSDHIGTASDVLRAFQPDYVYTPYYYDEMIRNESRLWDNQYVYDRLVDAVESYGGALTLFLDPDWQEGPGDDSLEGENPGELPEEGDPVDTPDSGEEDFESFKAAHTGSPELSLGTAQIEIMNYDLPDTNYAEYSIADANDISYGVKVTAANGRVAFLAGDIDDRNDVDESVGGGDETKLAETLRGVDFLKLGHHGHPGSNTPSFLRSILRPVSGGARPVVAQTGLYSLMPLETVQALHSIGVRHFNVTRASDLGKSAFVASLGASGVTTNVDGDDYVLQKRNEAPTAFLYSNGVPFLDQDGWEEMRDGWRYFQKDSSVALGWHQIDGKWYCFFQGSGLRRTGWVGDGNLHYYLEADGAMRIGNGWSQINGKWYYYADASGAVATGWVEDAGHRYYLAPGSGAMATGWAQADGKWYYLDGSGAMKTGWQLLGGKWYYLDGSGAMVEGWAKLSGKWYYLAPGSGAMVENSRVIDDVLYHFDASGAMI